MKLYVVHEQVAWILIQVWGLTPDFLKNYTHTHTHTHTQRYMYICESVRCSVMSDSLQPHGPEPTKLLCPQNSPGKTIEVGNYFLLTGVFPTRD